ncbi:MAG: hypothetical protein IKG21_00320 [Atopobiaceae bacterium]|nr:hypothetical protein [Atopobiaceae bacterium]
MRKVKMFDGKRHVYDTTKSTELGTRNFGAYGDPAGYAETLYQTRPGFYFIVGVGGDQSPYAEGEELRPISEDEAKAWQE